MQIIPKDIRNILAVRNDRFGEFLLNIPAFRALKESFTNTRLVVVVDPYVKDLAEAVPFIDEVIAWGRGKHSLLAKLKLIKLLSILKMDMAIMLNPSKEFNIISRIAGIPIRVGYNRKWAFLLTHKMEDEKHLGQKHEVEYNLDLVSLVGAKTEDKTLSLFIDDEIVKDFNIKEYNNLIAIHPWTSDPVKHWPLSNFSDLAKRILEDKDIKVVIIGGSEELERSADYFANLGNNLINLTGRTTLKQLAALLRKCKLLISCDSGPVHLACAVGIPAIAIFRSDIPGKSAKRWGPWGKGHTVIEKESLHHITVEEVLHKIKERLR